MKLIATCLVAVTILTCFSSCASDDNDRGYGAYQQRAQHAGYDPTDHVRGTRY